MTLQFVMLGAADLEQSARFYSETLGLQTTARFEDFAFFNTGAVTLALSGELARRGEAATEQCEFVFGVESVTAEFERLKARGVGFLNEPRQINAENWGVNFRDPGGHLLSLYGKQ
jgi:catechol 2,3-dioxygenase-like lactoylglutathione lyase family enzyme